MGIYKGQDKILSSITAVEEAKVKEIVDSEMTNKGVCTTKVADVPLTKLTVNSWASGNIFYCVKNGVCFVWINGFSSSTMSTQGQIITSGLPIPVAPGMWFGISSNSLQGSILVQIDGNGSLVNYIGANNIAYYDSFSYPVAES